MNKKLHSDFEMIQFFLGLDRTEACKCVAISIMKHKLSWREFSEAWGQWENKKKELKK